MLLLLIRFFFIFISSTLLYFKILNLSVKRSYIFISILVACTTSYIHYYLYDKYDIPPTLTLVVSMFIYCSVLIKKNILLRIYSSIISSAIGCLFFGFSALFISPITYIFFYTDTIRAILEIITMCLIGIFEIIAIILFFRIRRFRSGIPNINKKNEIHILVLLCFGIIVLMTFGESHISLNITFITIFIIFLSSFVVYFEIKKNIKQTYLNTLHTQERDQLELLLHSKEDEILALKKDVDNLSKMIHKDNKLIPAFMTAVEDLYLQNKNSKSDQLLQELHHFMHDRNYTLNYQNKGDDNLQKTGIASIDYVMKYLHLRAMNENILFRVAITTEPFSLTDSSCHQHDLRTLLADLGENAIHAVSNNENSLVYVELGFQEDILFLSVYDTGHYFDYEVLKNIGKSRFTTRLKNGGSGIGLMQTMEILNRYQASFQLKEFTADSDYSKAIHIRFDSRNKREICSDRSELTKLKSIRSDWCFTAS